VFEHATAQPGLERLAHVHRQRTVLRRHLPEQVRTVRLHQGVQQRAPGIVARIGRCGRARARSGANGVRRRASRRRGLAQHCALLRGEGWSVFRAEPCTPMDAFPARG
jgi:hypothetical protein